MRVLYKSINDEKLYIKIKSFYISWLETYVIWGRKYISIFEKLSRSGKDNCIDKDR
jgi:hypothetical protein